MNLSKIDHIIIMVKDMERSVEFYHKILKLPLKFQSDHWTEFHTAGTTLALHSGGEESNASPSTNSPHNTVAGASSISFDINDVQDVYAHLKTKGVPFKLPPTERTDEGIILAICTDPNGFEICFAQKIAQDG